MQKSQCKHLQNAKRVLNHQQSIQKIMWNIQLLRKWNYFSVLHNNMFICKFFYAFSTNVTIMSSNKSNDDLWWIKLRNKEAWLVKTELKLLNRRFYSAHSNYSSCQQDENLLPQEVIKTLMHSYTTQPELHLNETVLSNSLTLYYTALVFASVACYPRLWYNTELG